MIVPKRMKRREGRETKLRTGSRSKINGLQDLVTFAQAASVGRPSVARKLARSPPTRMHLGLLFVHSVPLKVKLAGQPIWAAPLQGPHTTRGAVANGERKSGIPQTVAARFKASGRAASTAVPPLTGPFLVDSSPERFNPGGCWRLQARQWRSAVRLPRCFSFAQKKKAWAGVVGGWHL
ncbi:hypothetical protein NLG97_g3293 [Lecanicillium saksenae]|uniref:Uncharacterized protein n=1 Tax=Lecanicillium saksenae TaxID=468837 RepID=A0ACC1R1S3_9HYPO|nr:hypothetical protein NLG97_g3293 [Lecanicillium saksenae]